MKIYFSKKIFVGILIIFAILILGFLILKGQRVEIVTDGIKYDNGGLLRIKIRNLSLNRLCFSSCYPYYLERKVGEWKSYNYQDCPDSDLVERCIEPGKTKAFEIILPTVKEGPHRIAVPICENCKIGEEFKETERFYSNEFEIR